jgi:AcrR family transcriptional regulator
MGNREDLLEGAVTCLRDKGYARTTARDIATAAHTSLAAIGYHYGSTRSLLNAAVYVSVQRLSDELQDQLRIDVGPDEGYLPRFEALWRRIIQSITSDRAVWAASLDVLGQVEHVPELRVLLAAGQHEARTGSVATFDDVVEDTVDEDTARSLGSFYHALITGIAVQWLVDPEHAPSAADLTAALRVIAGRVVA